MHHIVSASQSTTSDTYTPSNTPPVAQHHPNDFPGSSFQHHHHRDQSDSKTFPPSYPAWDFMVSAADDEISQPFFASAWSELQKPDWDRQTELDAKDSSNCRSPRSPMSSPNSLGLWPSPALSDDTRVPRSPSIAGFYLPNSLESLLDLDKDWQETLIASLLEDVEDQDHISITPNHHHHSNNMMLGNIQSRHSNATVASETDCNELGHQLSSQSHTRGIHERTLSMPDPSMYTNMFDHRPMSNSSINSLDNRLDPHKIYSSPSRSSSYRQPPFRKSSAHNHNNKKHPAAHASPTITHHADWLNNNNQPSSPRSGSSSRRFSKPMESPRQSKGAFTKPGEITCVSPACVSIFPVIRPSESLAPLHIVLPITLPFGKIIIAQNLNQPGAATCDFPPHHYYFQKHFPNANQMFSRLHGLSNQSPAWLALDVGYVACREHQVPYVVDLFNNFFSQGFRKIAQRRSRENNYDCRNSLTRRDEAPTMGVEPIRLRCRGLRLREDHGSGWYLYESPVEACSMQDSVNFREVIRLIENFNAHVRLHKLCQNATMKPFTKGQFAVVVVKQEGCSLPDAKVELARGLKCEGVELSEVRLVRHKLQDKFGNALFERDPRFGSAEIFGRPIAHNVNGRHARCVFAEAALPDVVRCAPDQINSTMAELENDLAGSDFGDDCAKFY